jgi:hypothetical protein
MDTADLARNIFAAIFGLVIFQPGLADGKFDADTGQETNWANAGYPPNFAALCEGDLTPARQAAFDSNLAKAEQALKAGDMESARDALGRADSAGMRGPNETFFGAAIKCQGEAKARRLFIAWRDYYLALKAQGRKDIPIWVIVADSGKSGLLEYTQNYDGDEYRRAVIGVQKIIDSKEQERDYGAFLLSQEQAMLQASIDAIPAMQAYAESKHTAALAEEEKAFRWMPTQQEMSMIESSAAMGAGMGMAMDSELVLTGRRVSLSADLLQDARDWNFVLFKDSGNALDNITWQQLPSSKRAQQRGDTIMSKANDGSLSYESRDAYYEMAIDYYSFGHWNSQRDAAVAAKARIQDSLLAEQQQAAAKVEQMQADMEVRLKSAEQGMEAMKKTDAEKKSFNDEADALEAELGF